MDDDAPDFVPPPSPVKSENSQSLVELGDFHFYLSLHDRRACWTVLGPGLVESPFDWAVMQGALTSCASSGSSVLNALLERVGEWNINGRPQASDWAVRLVPGAASTGDISRGGFIQDAIYDPRTHA